MNGTTGGWQMPNLGTLYGMGVGVGGNNMAAATDWASLTPAQQQQRRQQMYAQALMGQTSTAPQRSGWGAVGNAMNPIMGAAMMRWGGNQPTMPTTAPGNFGMPLGAAVTNPVTGF